ARMPPRSGADGEAAERQPSDASDTLREERRKRRERRTAELGVDSQPARQNRKNKERPKRKPSPSAGRILSQSSTVGQVHPQRGSEKFPVAILNADERVMDKLFSALADQFAPLQFERTSRPLAADLLVSVGLRTGQTKRKSKQIAVIVDVSGSAKENASIAREAKTNGAVLVRVEPLFRRHGRQ